MRIGNSFSEGEIDLLTQVCKGLVHRGKDLSYLARHPSFAMLANKVHAMAGRIVGGAATARPRVRPTQEAVLAVLRGSGVPDMSMREVLVAMPGRTLGSIEGALKELVARGAAERTKRGRYRVMLAKVVSLPVQKPIDARPAESAVRS